MRKSQKRMDVDSRSVQNESTNQLAVFENEQFGSLRTAGTLDYPLFCAVDVCAALGYSNSRKALLDHVDKDDVTKRDTIDSMGRNQKATFVNESGLYSLIFGSKLKNAKVYKRWVTNEVLPAIRKTGHYEVHTSNKKSDLESEKLRAAAEDILNFVFQDRSQGKQNFIRVSVLDTLCDSWK